MSLGLILFGGPGSGKGTQGSILQIIGAADPEHPTECFITSDELRARVAKGDELGREIDKYMSVGKLAPTEVTMECLRRRVMKVDPGKSILFDGAVRTLEQAQTVVEDFLQPRVDHVITLYLHCSDDLLRQRLERRAIVLKRPDDQRPEVINDRIRIYKEEYLSIRGFLESNTVFHEVNASMSVLSITAAITAFLLLIRDR